ncbi:dynein axonemal assembly factor 6 isoform X1 [Sminthopsis crassicaudata]|uniref:dynein axonemal assembly factor 6 isoform X1 n=1 Tax=Sminthopsis crassicaudata TaxID=9301 RepID=UPI003D68EC79
MNLEDLCSASALQALSKLLSPPEEEEDDLEQVSYPSSAVGALSPGNIGPAKKEESKVNPPNNTENRKDIWDPEEVPEGLEFDDMWDPREQPEYDIIFKQQVGAEDVFLGMTRKDPSTACCEDLLIRQLRLREKGTCLEPSKCEILEPGLKPVTSDWVERIRSSFHSAKHAPMWMTECIHPRFTRIHLDVYISMNGSCPVKTDDNIGLNFYSLGFSLMLSD